MSISLKGALFSTSLLTALSRIFGFIREVIFLAVFGSSQITDVYLFAFRLTNLFRQVLGESNADSAFLPSFVQLYTKGREKEAWRLARAILFYIILFSALAMLILFIFFPLCVGILAPGFTKEMDTKLIWYVKTMLPIILFLALSAYAGAILQAFKRFASVYFAPALSSIGFIIILYAYKESLGERVLSYAINIGTLAQAIFIWLFLIPLAAKNGGLSPSGLKGKVEGLKQVANLSIPIIFSTALEKSSSQFDLLFASLLETGSITALYTSYRLFHLPYAVIGVTIGKVYLPYLSKDTALHDFSKFIQRLIEAIRLNFLLFLPTITFTIILAEPIVSLAYKRGSFGTHATLMTTLSLQCYAGGLLPLGLVAILNSAFHSNLNTKKPVIAAAIGMALNIIFNYILMHTFLTYGGLALGTTLAFICQTGIMFYWLNRFVKEKGYKFFPDDTLSFLYKNIILNLIPAIIIVFARLYWNEDAALIVKTLYLIVSAILFSSVYLILGMYIFKFPEFNVVKKYLTR